MAKTGAIFVLFLVFWSMSGLSLIPVGKAEEAVTASWMQNRFARRIGSEFLGKRFLANNPVVDSGSLEAVITRLCNRVVNMPVFSYYRTNYCWKLNHQEDAERISKNANDKRYANTPPNSGKRFRPDANIQRNRIIGSEFLGKRAMMGSEFLGKRGNFQNY